MNTDTSADDPPKTEGKWVEIHVGSVLTSCPCCSRINVCAASKAVRELIGCTHGDLLDICAGGSDDGEGTEIVVRQVHQIPKALVEPLRATGLPIMFLGQKEIDLLGRPKTVRVRLSKEMMECP